MKIRALGILEPPGHNERVMPGQEVDIDNEEYVTNVLNRKLAEPVARKPADRAEKRPKARAERR